MAKKKARKKKAARRKSPRRGRRRGVRIGPDFEPCRFEGTTLVCVATPAQVKSFARREKRRSKLASKAAATQNRSALRSWFEKASGGQGLDGRRKRRRSR